MQGALAGWDLHQLVTWTDQALIRPGRLMTRYPFPRVFFHEPQLGVLSYGLPNRADAPGAFLSHARAPQLIRCAHRNILDTLEGMLHAAPDDRFVQSALYAGRVCRTRAADGQRRWGVMLTENISLTDQVLALFVADLLEHRADYETNLVVCASCEQVGFWPDRLSQRGCPEHPEAVLSALARRTSSS